MNYKVLYRKYRPKNFDEIIGQKNTVTLLKECIANKKISHAYIFSGPRGTGKTSSAKIFAKAVNCENSKDGNPCNKCDNCLRINDNSDIYEIDAASNNGVDQVRELIDNIKLAPLNSKYKVYIIDEVHMLSTSAFNALLLTLEEPPSHVIFILATTDIENVPITVLSRCQRIDFKRVSKKDLINILKNVAEKEKIKITDEAIDEVAEYADGGVRDSLSILDQLSKNSTEITQEEVLKSLGSVSNREIMSLIDSLEKNSPEEIIKFIERARENAVDFKTIIKKIIYYLEKDAISIKLEGIEKRLSYTKIKELCIELANLVNKNAISVDQFVLLEITLINYVDGPKKQDISREITNDNKEIKEEKHVDVKSSKNDDSKDKNNNTSLAEIRINNCFVKADKKYLEEAKKNWQNFLDKNTNRQIKGIVSDFDVVLASDEIMIFKSQFEDKIEKFNSELNNLERNFNKIENKNYRFASVTQENWQLEMDKFRKNKEEKVKYEYIEEPSVQVDSEISDIFSNDVIEIKEG